MESHSARQHGIRPKGERSALLRSCSDGFVGSCPEGIGGSTWIVSGQ